MAMVEYSMRGATAVIRINNPPVNALSQSRGVVEGILNGIKQAAGDAAVKVIVLIGAGRGFSGGADITEFNKVPDHGKPDLRDLIAYMDTVEKPLVCAVHGATMGGGVETALACHYRVSAPDAQLALSEVKLGLLPGAGGTQRLPRLVGADAALKIILSGDPVKADKALSIGLVDEIVSGDLLSGAIAFANKIVAEGRPLHRTSALSVKTDGENPAELIASAKQRVTKESRCYPAPLKCVECVETAVTRPFNEGQAFEHRMFDELLSTTESKSLIHLFFSERAAAKIPDVPEDTPILPIKAAAMVGAGTMGVGISMNFANAGIPVKLLEVTQEALDRALVTIRNNYANTVAKGRITQEAMDQRMALVYPTLSYDDLKDVDIVIEGVFEDMAVKKQVFQALDRTCKPGAILATNTSTLDVDEIAATTSRPESVIGLHFFSPANVMRLLEIVRGAKSSKSVIATCMRLSKTLRKIGVLVGVCDGFVGNRMVNEYLREAGFLLEEGATPQQVDQVLQRFGLAMGPFAMSDLAGLDVGWYIRKRQEPTRRKHLRYSEVADQICKMGRFGQKTRAGYYRYEVGSRAPIPDPVIEELVVKASKKAAIKRREISDREIIERTIYALINEGAKILEEGIAQRASDIDLVYVNGYGFPAYRGGPMFYADTVGLDKVYAKVCEYYKGQGEYWRPAPLLQQLAEQGRRFNSV
jgi:3-hydroxyacyl-CoA dehydrogenase